MISKVKKCRVCNVVLTEENSYLKNSSNWLCKDHKSQRTRKYYASDRGKETREARKSIVIEQHKRYRQSQKGKAVQRKKSKTMQERYPEKYNARKKLRYEVKMGRVKRLPCEKCSETKVHGHHTDYSKPLDVRWLCALHHREIHGYSC